MKVHLRQRVIRIKAEPGPIVGRLRSLPRPLKPSARSWLLATWVPLPADADEHHRSDCVVELLWAGPTSPVVDPAFPGLVLQTRSRAKVAVRPGWFELFNIEVQPEHQRRGLATALVRRTHEAVAPRHVVRLASQGLSRAGALWQRAVKVRYGWL